MGKGNKKGISDELKQQIAKRGEALLFGDLETVQNCDWAIRSRKKYERQQYMRQVTSGLEIVLLHLTQLIFGFMRDCKFILKQYILKISSIAMRLEFII